MYYYLWTFLRLDSSKWVEYLETIPIRDVYSLNEMAKLKQKVDKEKVIPHRSRDNGFRNESYIVRERLYYMTEQRVIDVHGDEATNAWDLALPDHGTDGFLLFWDALQAQVAYYCEIPEKDREAWYAEEFDD